MVDKPIILRKLSELDLYKKQIKEFSNIKIDVYKADWKTQRIVERTLQMMIETCADIANHIVSYHGMRIPINYADTFKVLSENSVINAELFTIMNKMAKFRNVVVHQYENVDAEIVILILKKHLKDFELYSEAILAYIKNLQI
ncbi:MAG: DUF86 domain-containing protein [Spirochaetota bacterium]